MRCPACGAAVDDESRPADCDRGVSPRMYTDGGRAGAAEPSGDSTSGSTRIGLDRNVTAALAYSLTFVTGLAFYLLEDDEFVRFHAAQSTAVFGVLFGLSFLLSILETLLIVASVRGLSTVLDVAWLLLAVTTIGLWLGLMVQASRGKRTAVPGVGRLIDA